MSTSSHLYVGVHVFVSNVVRNCQCLYDLRDGAYDLGSLTTILTLPLLPQFSFRHLGYAAGHRSKSQTDTWVTFPFFGLYSSGFILPCDVTRVTSECIENR